MTIKQIELKNIGSYEGVNTFNFDCDDPQKQIVIIGGKNGAGKTTLFTAIQLCLYGYHTYGFKTASRLYQNEIRHTINNHAILNNTEDAYIKIIFSNIEAREINNYVLKRSWTWKEEQISETLVVYKNDILLNEDQTHDFENYLIHLIPPEMLKLYFFDGEKIADYFLSEQRINIREALMILSGNDTYDIIQQNIKRIHSTTKASNDGVLANYLKLKDQIRLLTDDKQQLIQTYQAVENDLQTAEAEKQHLSENYAKQGGLTIEEWQDNQNALKEEENKRERINSLRKTYATDLLPFIIAEQLTARVLPQIHKEEEELAQRILNDKLNSPQTISSWSSILHNAGINDQANIIHALIATLIDTNGVETNPLFQLSDDEKMQIHAVMNKLISFDRSTFSNLQDSIDSSIERSKIIRAKLAETNPEKIKEYTERIQKLDAEIHISQARIGFITEQIELKNQQLEEEEKSMAGARKELEAQLKKNSIGTISANLLLMIEQLQQIIYTNLIKRVEKDLNEKLSQLIRKKEFFEYVSIDQAFNVHIIRKQKVSMDEIRQIYANGGTAALTEKLGKSAIEELLTASKTNKISETMLNRMENRIYELPMELDKERMSSGEKQIFVMALYYAIMQQSTNKLPFVIDTPFARIDSEHRNNITKHFFMELPGQLIILSTNEELDESHLSSMRDSISQVYLLEYTDEKRTQIIQGSYFEG